MCEPCRGGEECEPCRGGEECVSRAGEGRDVCMSHVACELYSYLRDAFCRCEF